MGGKFIVTDSVRKIEWRITNEIKDIAGYNCRRANAVIMDSVYVVAFYTDQIVPKTGPESFTGLPGMILGVALPHEHITWFAKNVFIRKISNEQLMPPTGGKKVTMTEMQKSLTENPTIKSMGQLGYLFLRNYLL